MRILYRYKKAVVLVACLTAGLVILPECWAFSGKVVDLRAGDLLIVSAGGLEQSVRLFGIACPVFGQPFYDRALFMAKFLSLHRNVEVTEVFKDENGVENALVRIEGVADYLNNQLIGYGLAWVRPCDSKSRLCVEWRKQEGLAQMNFIGLWAQPPAIAPWEWKQAQRMQMYERSREPKKRPNN